MLFRKLLSSAKKVLTIEYNPPKGTAINLDKIRDIEQLIDGVNVTDCPMSNLRMNSIIASYLIKQHLRVSTIFNLTCRDRNELALSSDLLGAWSLGLTNVLAINGDAILDNIKENVYRANTYGLLDIILKLNKAQDYKNRPIKTETDFFAGVASNIPKRINIKGIGNRLAKKESFGAKYIITQPIYSIESLEYFLEAADRTKMYRIIGFFAPPNLKVAKYLDEHVKGIDIPMDLLNRFKEASAQADVGYLFIEELIEQIYKYGLSKEINGIHLMRYNREFVEHVYDIIKGDQDAKGLD